MNSIVKRNNRFFDGAGGEEFDMLSLNYNIWNHFCKIYTILVWLRHLDR